MSIRIHTYLLLSFLITAFFATAQERPMNMPKSGGAMPSSIPGINQISGLQKSFSGGGQGTDSLARRDKFEDSLTISFQLLSSLQSHKLDSTISDFTKRFPIPADHIFLGNIGTATRSMLFSTEKNIGWNHGFHAFDVYRWKPEEVRFFNTTRPYTELAYFLGGRTEQIIETQHTQNIKPNWNVLFQYRLINSPGVFKNQKTNHNNYLVTSWFQSVNKRYNNYFVILSNKIQSEENGGIKNDKDYLNDPIYSQDRFNIPTQLGGNNYFTRNFFNNTINTGNKYADASLMVRQQYDFGKKDSLVSDSTVVPLFYPRLRFEYSFHYNKYQFEFMDNNADSLYYKKNYGFSIRSAWDTVLKKDIWKEVVNEFSIYQFPDAKNLLQFIKAGIQIQNLQGNFSTSSPSFYNLVVLGAYQNVTKNKKWDLAASGMFYLNGFNSGDYTTSVNLKKFSGKQSAYVELGFSNSNRSSSFLFDRRSSFYLDGLKEFKKENDVQLSASFFIPKYNFKLSGNYFLISNYLYYTTFYKLQQEATLFYLIRITAEKKFKIGKNWVWYADVTVQQKSLQSPINVPLLFIRNRFGYDGNLGFKNLNISIGLESRYQSAYKADSYSPLMGKFFFQDSITINNIPDLAAFVHFRIRSFRAFVRAENLHTLDLKGNFKFTNNSLAAAGYPYPGMVIRLGIYWSFVN